MFANIMVKLNGYLVVENDRVIFPMGLFILFIDNVLEIVMIHFLNRWIVSCDNAKVDEAGGRLVKVLQYFDTKVVFVLKQEVETLWKK